MIHILFQNEIFLKLLDTFDKYGKFPKIFVFTVSKSVCINMYCQFYINFVLESIVWKTWHFVRSIIIIFTNKWSQKNMEHISKYKCLRRHVNQILRNSSKKYPSPFKVKDKYDIYSVTKSNISEIARYFWHLWEILKKNCIYCFWKYLYKYVLLVLH